MTKLTLDEFEIIFETMTDSFYGLIPPKYDRILMKIHNGRSVSKKELRMLYSFAYRAPSWQYKKYGVSKSALLGKLK